MQFKDGVADGKDASSVDAGRRKETVHVTIGGSAFHVPATGKVRSPSVIPA